MVERLSDCERSTAEAQDAWRYHWSEEMHVAGQKVTQLRTELEAERAAASRITTAMSFQDSPPSTPPQQSYRSAFAHAPRGSASSTSLGLGGWSAEDRRTPGDSELWRRRLDDQLERTARERDRMIEASRELPAELRSDLAGRRQAATTVVQTRVGDTLRALRQRRRDEALMDNVTSGWGQ